jgi:hypothetical protein
MLGIKEHHWTIQYVNDYGFCLSYGVGLGNCTKLGLLFAALQLLAMHEEVRDSSPALSCSHHSAACHLALLKDVYYDFCT